MISPKFDTALRDGIRELGLTDKVDLLGPVDHEQIPALISRFNRTGMGAPVAASA